MIANINTVNYKWTFSDVIKSEKQACNCRFSRATVTDDSNALVRLNSQIELAKYVSATTGVSKVDVSKFYASAEFQYISGLFWINDRRFFNNTENCARCLLCLRNAWHLTNAYTAADCANKNNVASGKNALRVQAESLNENSGNVKDKRDKDKSDWSRVPEEKSTDVRSFNVSKVRNNKELRVPIKNKLQILLSEWDYCPVVHNDVIE